MLSVNQLTAGFGGRMLFENISFLVTRKDRVGLVGKNGAGKSTLLRIIAGQQLPESGNIAMQKELSLGYLSQDIVRGSNKSVAEEAASAFEEANALQQEMEKVAHELATRTDFENPNYMKLAEHYQHLHDRFEMIDGHTSEGDMEKVLLGLGFERTDFTRPCTEFSGGWRMRIELARILLRRPDLILLDEPTNHLDIESIQWLEDFLETYPGAVVLVSHDKALLDHLTNRTIEITSGKIYDFKTNYSGYISQREERISQQQSAKKNQDKFIEHTEELINKFRAKKNKASFAQSLIKKLDKLERVEVDELDTRSMKFRFPPAERAGKIVLRTDALEKSFGEKMIFSELSIEIERAEKVALAGRNGEGKSTFVKVIAGLLPYGGNYEIGHNVKLGYFAQNQAELLQGDITVLETIENEAKGDMRKEARNILGMFLFSGDDVFKKVSVLSGGERNRLALCKLLLEPYNLLVLDEPTNHLDLKSKEVLKQALLQFDGTLILVSHDRDFLHGLTNRIIYFKHGKVKSIPGGIQEFMEAQKIEHLRHAGNEKALKKSKEENKQTEKAQTKQDPVEKKEYDKRRKKLDSQIKKAEEEIAALELKEKALTLELANPDLYGNQNIFKEKLTQHQIVLKQLEQKMNDWEKWVEEAKRC
jgi:ATP-binding cassette subfamily F protein 3